MPLPGSPISKRPRGSQPVVLKNTEMGSSGRNLGTFRPRTAEDEYAARTGTISRAQAERKSAMEGKCVRRTQRMVLNCGGQPIAEDCSRSSWTFKKPLDRIIYERPSTVGSSLAYAPVPDCAEAILIDGSYGTLAGAAKQRINEKTTKTDKLFLIPKRPRWRSYADPCPLTWWGALRSSWLRAPLGETAPCGASRCSSRFLWF